MIPEFLYSYRKQLTIGLLIAIIAGLPFLGAALTPNNALTVWFLESDPNLIEYNAFHDQFGNDEMILIAIEQKKGVFSAGSLQNLRKLTANLSGISGIDTVISLANIYVLDSDGSKLRYAPLVPDSIPMEDSLLAGIKRQALHSDLIHRRLINEDATITLMIVQMEIMADIDAKRDRIVKEVGKIARTIFSKEDVHLGGFGVMYAGLNELTQRDFGIFMTLSYTLMFVLIWLLYREVKIVLLAMGSIFAATLLTLELFGVFGYQINLVTIVIPTLIIILGIMDIMHVINAWYHLKKSGNEFEHKKDRIVATLRRVIRPCFFTTLTTIAGFLSLAASPMAVLREFGLFSAVGMACSLICAFVLSPFVFDFLEEKEGRKEFQKLDQWLLLLPGHLQLHRRWYGLLFSLMAVVMAWGASKIVIDTYTVQYFPEDHPVITDHRWMENNWGGYFLIELTLRPVESVSLKDPRVLAAMGDFIEEVKSMPEVNTGFGLHNVYEHIFPMMYGVGWQKKMGQKAHVNLLTRQILRRDSLALRQLANQEFKLGRMTLTGKLMSVANLARKLEEVEAISKRHFEGLAEVRATGYPSLYTKIIEYVMDSQTRSFFLALLMIFLLMWFMLKNLRLTLLAMVPNLFPVMLMFGIMGWFDINLDIAVATIAATVLGISIDDTVHLAYQYQVHRWEGMPVFRAIQQALSHVGRVVVITSIVLFLGYCVLLFASVKTVFYFGLLTGIAVLGALLADLGIFPLLLLGMKKGTRQNQ